MTGIYVIRNLVNGKVYIGSAADIERRWTEHKKALLRNTHHSIHLQRAWVEYGHSRFAFEVLELCTQANLLAREQVWIDLFDSCNKDKGYNMRQTSETDKPSSQEYIERLRDGIKRRNLEPKYRTSLRRANVLENMNGYAHTERALKATKQHKQGKFGRRTWKK